MLTNRRTCWRRDEARIQAEVVLMGFLGEEATVAVRLRPRMRLQQKMTKNVLRPANTAEAEADPGQQEYHSVDYDSPSPGPIFILVYLSYKPGFFFFVSVLGSDCT